MPSAHIATAPGLSVLTLSFFVLIGVSNIGLAAQPDDLYTGRTIVTGEREETRIPGIGECLRQVLVKVSGNTHLLNHPDAKVLVSTASFFVAKFSYRDRLAGIPIHDEQGSRDRPYFLTVFFDPAKIDAALVSLGSKPWRSPRPRLAIFLAVRNGDVNYMLAKDGERGIDQRESLADASWRFGMPMLLPRRAAFTAADLDFGNLFTVDHEKLETLTEETGGDLPLAGRLDWRKDALGWVAEWRLTAGNEAYSWQTRGVNFDEAFRVGLGGAAHILSGHGQP
jgi:hypothetical protein